MKFLTAERTSHLIRSKMQSLTLENFQPQKLIWSETTSIKAYFKAQEHPTLYAFQFTKFSKEYEWELKIMHLPLSDQRAGFSPAICSSSSYHLQSSISSLLLYIKDCFNTCASPTQNFSGVKTGNTLSQCLYKLSLPTRFLTDSWVANF